MLVPLRLVVAEVDSAQGDAAAWWGAAAAARYGCRLLLLRAGAQAQAYQALVDPADRVGTAEGTGSSPLPALTDLGSRLRSGHPGLDVATWLTHQDPATALLSEAREGVLLVVGAMATASCPDEVAGSLGRELLRRAGTAVVLVMPAQRTAGPVVVGVDSLRSRRGDAVAFAAREAALRGVGLHVVHTSPPGPADAGQATETDPSPRCSSLVPAEALSAALAEGLARYPDVDVRVSSREGQTTEILLAEAHSAQLLVLGVHPSPATPPALSGSAAQALARQAGCAVVVVPVRPGPGDVRS